MPPAYNQAASWEELNEYGTPFSTNPWDLRSHPAIAQDAKNDFTTVLPVCAAANSVGCIEVPQYSMDAGQTWSSAQQVASPGQRHYAWGREIDGSIELLKTSTYAANPSKGLFQGVVPNFWTLPGATHSLGEGYVINAVLHSKVAAGSNVAKVFAIDILANAGSYTVDTIGTCKYWVEDTAETFGVHPGYCYEAVNMPANLDLRVSVRLGNRLNELSGWFDGRLKDPVINFGTAKAGVLSVEGQPVQVNYMQTPNIPKSSKLYDVPPAIEKSQLPMGTRGGYSARDGLMGFIKFASVIPAKADVQNTVWRMSSWQQAVGISKCKSNPGVQGVVLSNATTYSSAPPSLNALTGNLSFQVASTHLNPDGSNNIGEYRLLLQQKLVKCIWGSNLTGAASISVVDSDGSTELATTSFGSVNGWAQFYAAGFHYSRAKIVMKLIAKKK